MAACVEQTEAVLALLKRTTTEHYDYVHQYVGAILCLEQGSGMSGQLEPADLSRRNDNERRRQFVVRWDHRP